jgi:hypothetical protein
MVKNFPIRLGIREDAKYNTIHKIRRGGAFIL